MQLPHGEDFRERWRAYQALTEAEDNDASYPAGCKVTVPACNGGKVPYCTCSGSAPGFSGWSCFF
jgi:hypothetical protein